MIDLERVREMIARVIDSMGGSAGEQRMTRDAWMLTKGSVAGFIVLLEDEENPADSDVLVRFRIMKVPPPRAEEFYRRLLTLNDELNGKAAFSVRQDNLVTLQAGRLAKDLDESELVDLIGRTAALADYYDDPLLNEFGREFAPD